MRLLRREEFQLPVFLTADNLKPFISKDFEGNSKPVLFRPREYPQ